MRDELLAQCRAAIRSCLDAGEDPRDLFDLWRSVPHAAQEILAEALAEAVDENPGRGPDAVGIAEQVSGSHVRTWLGVVLQSSASWLELRSLEGDTPRRRAARRFAHLSRRQGDAEAGSWPLADAGCTFEARWYRSEGAPEWTALAQLSDRVFQEAHMTPLAEEFVRRAERPVGRDDATATEWFSERFAGADGPGRRALVSALAELGEVGTDETRSAVIRTVGSVSGTELESLVVEWILARAAWLSRLDPGHAGETFAHGLVRAAFGDTYRRHPESREAVAAWAHVLGLQDALGLRLAIDDPAGDGLRAFEARVRTGRPLGEAARSLGSALTATRDYRPALAIARSCSLEDREQFFVGAKLGFEPAEHAALRRELDLA